MSDYRIKKGSLFVISAPSGAGKTTLCKRICESIEGLRFSVSFTTRKPRDGEIDGVHYFFIDEDEFRSMVSDGEFIEWAEVHGNFYGTSKKHIEGMISEGIDVLLDIDVQGARQIRDNVPDCITIFVLPPSIDELRKRLIGRMSDSEETIAKRLKKATEEISEYKSYDYVILNDVFETALKELESIIISERAKTRRIDHNLIAKTFNL